MGLKNIIGDCLGYARCPITADTYWRSKIATVFYAPHNSIVVSARLLEERSNEEIALNVLKEGMRTPGRPSTVYSIEEIAAMIPEKCFITSTI